METIDELAAHISDLVPGGISRKLLKQTLSAIFCERDTAHDRVDALANDVARLHRRIVKLDTVLEPFAACKCQAFPNADDEHIWLWRPSSTSDPDQPGINRAHIMAAQAALKEELCSEIPVPRGTGQECQEICRSNGLEIPLSTIGHIRYDARADLLAENAQLKGRVKELETALGPNPTPPKIVCLCGSTRFTEQMLVKSWELAKAGIIALGWNVLPDSYTPVSSVCALGDEYAGRKDALHIENHGAEAEGVKERIDELHKRKIDLADEVLVLNIGGYIGDSTRSEVRYAIDHNKPVCWLEPI